MAESAEVLEARIRDIAEREKQMLEQGSGSFQARFIWYDNEPDAPPRLIMMPSITPETRPYIPWAIKILCAVQPNLREVVFLMDGWYAKQMTKKDGTEWQQGDMEHAILNNTEDAELIGEGLTMTVAYADGNMGMATVKYTRQKDALGQEAVVYDWEESKKTIALVTADGQGAVATGFFPDLMKDAMATPKLTEAFKEQFGETPQAVQDALGLEQWQADMHMLAAGVKMVLNQAGFPCLVIGRSEAEQELIEVSMKEGPFVENIAAYNQDDIQEITMLEEIYGMTDPEKQIPPYRFGWQQ